MSSEPKKPDKPTEKDTVDRILQAAGDVFIRKGYAGARVEEIARTAGVNKAMLYYHVGDKQALFEAVLRQNIEIALTTIRAAVASEAKPEARLRAVLRGIEETTVKAEHLLLALREAAEGGERLSDELRMKVFELPLITAAIVRQGVAEGRFREVHPFIVHLLLAAPMMMFHVTRSIREEMRLNQRLPAGFPPIPGSIADAVIDVLLNGLMKREDPQ